MRVPPTGNNCGKGSSPSCVFATVCCVQAVHRREKDKSLNTFAFPYDLGWRSNLSLVVNRKLAPVGNGIDWQIRPGSNKYDFTVSVVVITSKD